MRVVAVAAMLTLLPAAAFASPPVDAPPDRLAAAVRCAGDPASSTRTPLLLVHGTGVTAQENWSVGYQQALQARGHAVCTVDMPDHAFGDVQVNVQYVAHAIRTVQQRAGRRISVIGHSQGAFEPLFALRVWPELAPGVEDFVGLAGVYDAGSEAIAAECRSAAGCTPSFHQMSRGSDLLKNLSRRALPAGPSYSAIGTDADETVTPQPAANRMPGVRSVQLQELCPGRKMPLPLDHVLMAGDAVAMQLVLDALDHDGPVDPARVTPSCGEVFFPEVDVVGFLLEAPALLTRQGPVTHTPPPTRCYVLPTCTSLAERGRMLGKVRVIKNKRVAVVLDVETAGQVKVRVGHRTKVRSFEPGRHRLTFPKRGRVTLLTKPTYYDVWVRER